MGRLKLCKKSSKSSADITGELPKKSLRSRSFTRKTTAKYPKSLSCKKERESIPAKQIASRTKKSRKKISSPEIELREANKSTLFEETDDFTLLIEPVANDEYAIPNDSNSYSADACALSAYLAITSDSLSTHKAHDSTLKDIQHREGLHESDEEPEKWEEDAGEAQRVENIRKRWQPYDYEAELFDGSDFEDA